MKRKSVSTWLAVIVLSAVVGICAQVSHPDVVQWLRKEAIPLDTPEAGHGFADMQPLKQMIGDARIVSLGEATHGTREFFQLKHRMLEFLATQMGFTIFSIEANMPEAYRLNDFVLTGKGDPAQLLKGMYFWTWNTEEVLDMIRWMREFNESGKGRIEFTGFDMQKPDVARSIAADMIRKYDQAYFDEAQRAWDDLGIAIKTRKADSDFGLAVASFPVSAAAGKQIRYSGYIKTEGVTREYAGLWWRNDGASGTLKLDNMSDRGAKGTMPWTRYEISLTVPADVKGVVFGVLHPGNGIAWFDSLQVEIDGVVYSDPQFDFDFESEALKGLSVGASASYRIGLDKEVAHSGKQSLRSAYSGSPEPTTPERQVDPTQALSSGAEILKHIEAERASWRKAGASDRDIDWAIQNARVVLQGAQMNLGGPSRDQSMAENIRWILDRAPGAKIVLWAHNGHVALTSTGYQPMGKYLRDIYGNKMVVLGFAFNQGAFQAVDMSGKGLRDFAVPAAPAGSLDATLAATGIPIFALDLRKVPTGEAVAEWLRAPHRTRSIGAGFSDAAAPYYLAEQRILETYDALLFVEKTTAARKNPAIPGK